MKNIGTCVRFYRNKQGLTQVKLAEKIKLSSNYIALIETGKKTPSLRTLDNIAGALSVNVNDLINDDPLFNELQKIVNKYGINQISATLQKLIN